MATIAESMEHLQLSTFFNAMDTNKYNDLFVQLTQLQSLFHGVTWGKLEDDVEKLLEDLDSFGITGSSRCLLFEYRGKFINCIAPVLHDLTRSFHEGDWNLHLSAVRRTIQLCFAFDRVNYKRWLPLYFEDCLALKDEFPAICKPFMAGGFVVRY